MKLTNQPMCYYLSMPASMAVGAVAPSTDVDSDYFEWPLDIFDSSSLNWRHPVAVDCYLIDCRDHLCLVFWAASRAMWPPLFAMLFVWLPKGLRLSRFHAPIQPIASEKRDASIALSVIEYYTHQVWAMMRWDNWRTRRSGSYLVPMLWLLGNLIRKAKLYRLREYSITIRFSWCRIDVRIVKLGRLELGLHQFLVLKGATWAHRCRIRIVRRRLQKLLLLLLLRWHRRHCGHAYDSCARDHRWFNFHWVWFVTLIAIVWIIWIYRHGAGHLGIGSHRHIMYQFHLKK